MYGSCLKFIHIYQLKTDFCFIMRIFALILITVQSFGAHFHSNTDKITKLQQRACKLILRNEYSNFGEAQDRLNMLSFSESVFLQKAKVM